MKFNKKHEPLPVSFMPQERVVEPSVILTSRVFPCFVCKDRTGFRLEAIDTPAVPCCSDECKATIESWEAELRPPSSSVERSLDTGEVTGPIPVVGTTEDGCICNLDVDLECFVHARSPATQLDEPEQRSDNNGGVGGSTPAQTSEAMVGGLDGGGSDDTVRVVPGRVLDVELSRVASKQGANGRDQVASSRAASADGEVRNRVEGAASDNRLAHHVG